MKDRVPQDPGRVKITKSDGSVEYVTIERADNPTQEGTPLNKKTLLSDSRVATLWPIAASRPSEPTVSDALGMMVAQVGNSDPTKDTSAPLGGQYINQSANGGLFTCVDIVDGKCVWYKSASLALKLQTQIITSSQTWTKPANLSGEPISVLAFGGGGGSGTYKTTNPKVVGGGGGGGHCNTATLSPQNLPESVYVAIGTGGTGGGYIENSVSAAPNRDGGTGGITSFGSFVSASGGSGGKATGSSYDGGDGGSGGGGGYRYTLLDQYGNYSIDCQGRGGNGSYGGGGGGYGTMPGGNGGTYGGGGGGGSQASGGSGYNGKYTGGTNSTPESYYLGGGGGGRSGNGENGLTTRSGNGGQGIDTSSIPEEFTGFGARGPGIRAGDGTFHCGGGGGGGYGGNGGYGGVGVLSGTGNYGIMASGGGGGGYGGNGGNADNIADHQPYGSGGGGYGGDANHNGGGGYGPQNYGAGGTNGGDGKSGVCIIRYYVYS